LGFAAGHVMVRGWSVGGWDRAERLKLRVVSERLHDMGVRY
jgi:hypothetical protein